MVDASVSQHEPKVGEILAGKYRVESVIGEGGMGTVFAAHHEVLDQTVAIKVLAPELAKSGVVCERFLREARSAAKLQSEHVARVMDAGTLENGLPFFVMERLEGYDFGALLRMGGPPLSVEDVAGYALEALEALAHAHGAGIVHRDIKPGNLFLATRAGTASVVKVLDFGISKATSGRVGAELRTLTGAAQIIGSPGYMSPEQVRDPSGVDARSDIWSLGVVMYELLTGKPAFDGDGVGKIFSAILEEPPPRLSSVREDIGPEFDAVVMRCLERPRERRYEDVAAFARALAPFAKPEAAALVERIEQVARAQPAVLGRSEDDAFAPTQLGLDAVRSRSSDAHFSQAATVAGLPKRGGTRLVATLVAFVLVGGAAYWFLMRTPATNGTGPLASSSAPSASASAVSPIASSGRPAKTFGARPTRTKTTGPHPTTRPPPPPPPPHPKPPRHH